MKCLKFKNIIMVFWYENRIVRFVKARRISWIVHVERMEDSRLLRE